MKNDLKIIDTLLSSNTPEAEKSIIAFAKHLALQPLTASTVDIFTKIINKNLPEAADILFSRRDCLSFFSTVPLSHHLVHFAVQTLSSYRYSELYSPILLSCLGIIMNNYKNSANGMTVYKISVSEIYHIAKYLEKKEETTETLILDIMEEIGNLNSDLEISSISKKILDYWYDNSKKLSQIIPMTILT